jgi:hypothetical protein
MNTMMSREERLAYAYERRLDGLMYTEIAVEMGVSPDTARRWCEEQFQKLVTPAHLAFLRRGDVRWTEARLRWLHRRQRAHKLVAVADWFNAGGGTAFDQFTRTLRYTPADIQTQTGTP